MWHHEDAGVGFNVFRAAVAANASATFVPVPAHYNDPGVIERSTSAQDEYWSTRSLFVHGIKTHRQYNLAASKWALGRPTAALEMRCKPCSEKGTNLHYGKWTCARLPCPLPPPRPPPPTADGGVASAVVVRGPNRQALHVLRVSVDDTRGDDAEGAGGARRARAAKKRGVAR